MADGRFTPFATRRYRRDHYPHSNRFWTTHRSPPHVSRELSADARATIPASPDNYVNRTSGAVGAADAAKGARMPFLMWLRNAFIASQQRRAEREIMLYLANRGQLTDTLEREIVHMLSTSARPLPGRFVGRS
jgi:hypothetical protein